MSCEVDTMWKENEFCSISEDLEIGRIDRTEIINQLLETTVWQQADESLIPECQADDDTLIAALVEKRFWRRGH